jgi:hypothetical protein
MVVEWEVIEEVVVEAHGVVEEASQIPTQR